MADLVVRDRKDYPDEVAARASLQPAYQGWPYVGVWLQPGDDPEYLMYVFTTRPAASLAAAGWRTEEAVGHAHGPHGGTDGGVPGASGDAGTTPAVATRPVKPKED